MHHVDVYPEPARKGEDVEIRYKGMLLENGADSVWVHFGYDGWNSTQTYPMWRQNDGSFACRVPAKGQKEVNFCFKDSAEHWDNNNGWDWNCEINSRGFF